MKLIPNAVSRTFGRQILILQKNSPKLLFTVGVVGVVAGTVMACKATLKLDNILDAAEEEIEAIKTDMKDKSSYHKDLAYVYAKNGAEVARLYAPAVLIGAASIAALTGSHVILTKRNASLTAAYGTIDKAFREYRERVKKELGESKEATLYRGTELQEIVDENGKKKVVPVGDPNKMSMYAKFFDEYNVNWKKDAEYNRIFIQTQMNYLNHLLHVRGHVFLNEAYDALGIERSSAGQIVGWVVDGEGDKYIDFGMFEANKANFINGAERSILLDFNVDGPVFDKI